MGHWGWGRVKAGKRGSRVIGEVKAEEGGRVRSREKGRVKGGKSRWIVTGEKEKN